jgi:hypothetical protein
MQTNDIQCNAQRKGSIEDLSLKKVKRVHKDLNTLCASESVDVESKNDIRVFVEKHLSILDRTKCIDNEHVFESLLDTPISVRMLGDKINCNFCNKICEELSVLSCNKCVYFAEVCTDCRSMAVE